MTTKEVYFRIKRMIIILLVLMTMFSFVAVITISAKLEDNIQAVDVLIEYIETKQ